MTHQNTLWRSYTLLDLVAEAVAVIREAETSTEATYTLFSGGRDSMAAAHLSARHARNWRGCLYLDTGVGLPENRAFVSTTCERYGWPLTVYRAEDNTQADGTPDPMRYDDIVSSYGFPGPSAHLYTYVKLKQRSLDRFARDLGYPHLALVTGVRRWESRRRMASVKAPLQRAGRKLYAAPLYDWQRSFRDAYLAHHGLPECPVYATLGVSGDCLCGAYADPGERAQIARHHPDMDARMTRLESRLWGSPLCARWGSGGRTYPAPGHDGDGMMLCQNCLFKEATHE